MNENLRTASTNNVTRMKSLVRCVGPALSSIDFKKAVSYVESSKRRKVVKTLAVERRIKN